ncbi:MAG: tyrosine-protein phosphatase [Kiritimatiellia bacterium]
MRTTTMLLLALTAMPTAVLAGTPEVSLQLPGHRAYFALERKTREDLFSNQTFRASMRATGDRPAPVALSWEGGTPPYAVRVVLGDRTVWTATVPTRSAEVYNLEIARSYAWDARDAEGQLVGAGSFRTADEAPRMILVPGVPNLRDLGGRIGLGGRRIRQGRVYRSAGWNNNSTKTVQTNGTAVVTNFQAGAVRFNADAERRFVRPLAIRTDLDLRSDVECVGMTGSPIGRDVRWIRISSGNYWELAKPKCQRSFAQDFRVFLDERNYPIVFHCIAGADRTGSLACILNGLLGVPEDELAKDWEATGFTTTHSKFRHATRWDLLLRVFDAYPGETLNERIEAYVRACGFSAADIARFRSLMLEPER